MAIEVLLDLIKQRFPPSDRKIAAKALRQDPLVWQFANADDESLPYFESEGVELAAFTPAACAFWLVGRQNEVEPDTISELDSTLPNALRQTAGKAFESTFNSGLPPADLYHAGLLALALRERRKMEGNWKGVADEIFIKRGSAAAQKNVLIWQTVFSILLSLMPDFIDLILELIRSKNEQQAKTGVQLLVHSVLSNPTTDQEKLDLIYRCVSGESMDLQLEALKWLGNNHQTSLSKTLALSLLQVKANVDAFAKVFSEWEAFETVSDLDDPLVKPVRFTLPEDLNRFAAFSFFSGDSQKASETYRKAVKVLDAVKAQTLFQAIADNIGSDDQSGWLEIIQSLPTSQKARVAYIQTLINEQKTDEALRLMAELPDSQAKSLLEAQIVSGSKLSFTPSVKRVQPPSPSYFIHSAEVNPTQVLLKTKSPQSIEVDFSDPEMIVIARDQFIQSHLYDKAIELTSYLDLLEPENAENPRKLAHLYALAGRWAQAYTAIQKIVKDQAAPEIQDLLLFAESSLHTERTDMSISISQNILKQDPQNPKALILLGEGFWQKGDIVKAVQHMERVVEIIPEEAETWLALARIWQENGQYDRALDVLQKGAVAIPGDAALLRQLGILLLDRQSPTDALTYLKKANSIDHENAEGQLHLAKAHYQLGHYAEAWQILEPFFDEYEQNNEIATLLGFVLLGMEKPTQAKPILIHAAGQSPDDREVVMAAARLAISDAETAFEETNQAELASMKAILSKALEGQPNDAYLQLHLADIERLQGQHQTAMDLYSKLADRMTSNKSGPTWQVQYGLGRTALLLGNLEMGLAALQEAAAKKPENTTILHGLAEAYQFARLPEKAIDTALTALKLAPRDVHNILWYAHFRSDNGQSDEAVKALKEALVLEPDRPELKIWLAKSLIATGETKAAEKYLSDMIIESTPTSQDLAQVAKMGVQLNNLDLAIRALEKATALSGVFNPDLTMNLAMAYATQGQRRKALETLNASDSILIQHPSVALMKADLLDALGQYQIALNTLNLIEEAAPAKLPLPDQQEDSVTKSPLLYAIDFSLPSYYVRLGQLYLVLGASDEADTNFKRALTVNPADHKARLASMESHALKLALNTAQDTAKTDWTALKPQEALDLACLQSEIHFYKGQPDFAEKAMGKAALETSSYPRALALKSRIAYAAGNLDQARELLDQALDTFQESFDPMPSSSAKDALRKLMNLSGIAEAALTLKDLPLAVDLYSRMTIHEINHPLTAWRYSVALMQAAEAQRLAEALSITTHAPGLSMVSDENYTQFSNCLAMLEPILSQEEWLCLKARGLAAFEGEWQFELNIDSCLNDPESAAAVILSSNDELTVRRTLEAHSDNAQVLQAFGVYALKHGKPDGIQMAQKALELDPANPVNHALLAFLNRQEPEQALNSIKTALQFWPEEAEWHALAADLELQIGLPESASEHIAFALDADPDNAKFWQKSAEIKLKQNDLEHARVDLEKSINYQSADVSAWMQLADVNRRMGDVSEAISNVKNAEKLDPDNKAIAIKEAQLLLDQNDYSEAANKATALLKQDNNDDDARIILAQAHARQGQFDQALSLLKSGKDRKSENPRLSLEAIKIRKEFEGAETVLPELISLADANPENPEVLTYLTDLMIQTNRLDEALLTAQTILRIMPEEAEVHLMLGRLQRKNGQLDQAIAHLSDAIAYEPGLVEAYIELGKTYQDRRNLEEAINIFKKGAEADLTDHRPYYFAGLALKECKDYAGAEAMLQQAKRNAPNDPDIIRQLGVITAMNLINHLRKSS